MARQFNNQPRDDSRPPSRNIPSNKYDEEEEQSSRPARPRLNRAMVDRGWENGTPRHHADYHPRTSNGQTPHNQGNRNQQAEYTSYNGPTGNRTNGNRQSQSNYNQAQRRKGESSPSGIETNNRQAQNNQRQPQGHGSNYRTQEYSQGRSSDYGTNHPQPNRGPAHGYGNNHPQPNRGPAHGYGTNHPQPNRGPAHGYGNNHPQPNRGPAHGYGNNRPQPNRGPAHGYGNNRPQPNRGSAHSYGNNRPQPNREPAHSYGNNRPPRNPERDKRGYTSFNERSTYSDQEQREPHPRLKSRPEEFQRQQGGRIPENTHRSAPQREQFKGDYEHFSYDAPTEAQTAVRMPIRGNRPNRYEPYPNKGPRPVQRKDAEFRAGIDEDAEELIHRVHSSPKVQEETASLSEMSGSENLPLALPDVQTKPFPANKQAKRATNVGKTKKAEAEQSPSRGPRPSQRGYKWPKP